MRSNNTEVHNLLKNDERASTENIFRCKHFV